MWKRTKGERLRETSSREQLGHIRATPVAGLILSVNVGVVLRNVEAQAWFLKVTEVVCEVFGIPR